jgi:RNA polymerase sigma factor (sigma-70 family)
MDLETAVTQAAGGDLAAFAEVTRRFQHMAFGYALSLVHDFGQAEDVVQEAFVAAWFGLGRLADPAAFPGWLRSIVRHQAYRVLRRRALATAPLGVAEEVPVADGPDGHAERRERIGAVLARIAELPRPLREVVTLFYVHECSQQDIATFLGLPVTTVNNRLHAARAQLKRRMLAMVKDTLEAHPLPDDFAARIGRIVRTQAPVVEARFDPAALPDVLSELTVSDDARGRAVTVQVVQHLPDGVVRGVVLSAAEELAPGMSVLSSGRRPESAVDRDVIDRTVAVLGRRGGAPRAVLETGIKVIDVMCPLLAGGTAAIAGEAGAGSMVLVEELVRRLSGGPQTVSLFTFIPPGPWPSLHEAWRKDGYSDGTVGAVQTFWLTGEEEWTPERLGKLAGTDVVLRMSRAVAGRRIYPPVDPLASHSRAIDEGLVGAEHAAIAARVRGALQRLAEPAAGASGDPADEPIRSRAMRLARFFGQPFYVAEPYTRRPGVTVSMAEALRSCREILDGTHDDLPQQAFDFDGGIDAIRARARAAAAP